MSSIELLTAQLIAFTIQGQRHLEGLKISLAENSRFDLKEAFNAIDIYGRGYITSNDINHFLEKN